MSNTAKKTNNTSSEKNNKNNANFMSENNFIGEEALKKAAEAFNNAANYEQVNEFLEKSGNFNQNLLNFYSKFFSCSMNGFSNLNELMLDYYDGVYCNNSDVVKSLISTGTFSEILDANNNYLHNAIDNNINFNENYINMLNKLYKEVLSPEGK